MNVRLICLDFDGTAVDYDGEKAFFHPLVAQELNRLGALGVEWCTNSGRSREDQESILRMSRSKGLGYMPSAILCSEAFIFDRIGDNQYAAREPWNSETLRTLVDFHGRVQGALQDRLESWQRQYAVEIRLGPSYTVFCVPGEEQQVTEFYTELSKAVSTVHDSIITRNGGWVVVLPTSMGKGNILNRYRQERGFRREEVLAVGDHLNDISMLDGNAAAWVACPADAKGPVLDTVRAARGFVAAKPGPLGTAEILKGIGGSIASLGVATSSL